MANTRSRKRKPPATQKKTIKTVATASGSSEPATKSSGKKKSGPTFEEPYKEVRGSDAETLGSTEEEDELDSSSEEEEEVRWITTYICHALEYILRNVLLFFGDFKWSGSPGIVFAESATHPSDEIVLELNKNRN